MTASLDLYRPQVEAYLGKLLTEYAIEDERLREAMAYAVQGGGKRFRPHLVLTWACLGGVPVSQALPTAAAIELIHCYSLVHDDLPGIDHSPLRRGKPSCWSAFDEATAILVGDGLLNFAFEVLANFNTSLPMLTQLKLIQAISKASGAHGMVGGQMRDMRPDPQWTLEHIERMQNQKTGALIAVSCQAGAILSEQPPSICRASYDFGLILGLIFQITDDLLDTLGTEHTLGKPIQQDDCKHTFVQRLGVKGAQEKLKELHLQAFEILKQIPHDTSDLKKVVDLIIKRCH